MHHTYLAIALARGTYAGLIGGSVAKAFDNIQDWTPKKLRTLRNNLNNRLASFKSLRIEPKELQKSHMLYGLEEHQCRELLSEVQKLLTLVDRN
jgi:nitrate reductase alpha subunit